MAKCDIHGDPNSNDKIGFQTSKWDIRPEFEGKIGFRMAQCYIRPNSNDKIGYQTSKCDNRPKFESQSRISNVKIRYLAQVRMSK